MSALSRRLLMVAFHFPPFSGSSGVQRTLRFVQDLPAFGWQTVVLTAHAGAYERTRDDLLGDIPPDTRVVRAFALDTARHLAIAGRYPAALARPDRWMSWRWGAVAAGIRLIDQVRPAAIWSTYPIATAHAIGYTLHRRSGLPWIADFRDPMVQHGYPADPKTWRAFQRIERDAVENAARVVFVTHGAARMYADRYGSATAARFSVIENGFDEESFNGLEAAARAAGPLTPGRVTLLHSGVVYASERDPTRLLRALRRLSQSDGLRGRVVLRFRASSNDALLGRLAREHDLQDMIELMPALAHREALLEMLRADGLVVLQASNSNEQIPGKVYEYLRARRPLIGLTDPRGDTAQLLRAGGINDIASLEDENAIADVLGRWIDAIGRGVASIPSAAFVAANTRRARAAELARLLDATIASAAGDDGAKRVAGRHAAPFPEK